MQRRKDRRIKQWNRITIRALSDDRSASEPAEVEAFTYDISLGGARIVSSRPFDVGTLLRLRIELVRTREVLSVEGSVKWLSRNEETKAFEMGIEFHHATSRTFMSLMKNLHDGRLSPGSPGPEPARVNRSGSL